MRIAVRTIAFAAGAAVAMFVLRSVIAGGSELSRAAAALSHPAAGWVAIAVALEAVSYLLYATAQRRLLPPPDRPPGVGWFASLSVAAQGLNNFLPGGYVLANILNFREIRRRGIPPLKTAWLLVTTSALYIGALILLAIVASQLAGSEGQAANVRYGSCAALGLAALIGAAGWIIAHRSRHERREAAGDKRWRRRLDTLADWRAKLAQVQIPRRRIASVGGVFAGCWVADLSCLIAAFFAVGATPPWQGLLLAYCGAQLVAFLPLTPGGVGLVEGSLAAGLAAFPGGHGNLLAAVLLFRLISYWGTLPAGLAGYAVVRHSAIRGAPRPAEPVLESA